MACVLIENERLLFTVVSYFAQGFYLFFVRHQNAPNETSTDKSSRDCLHTPRVSCKTVISVLLYEMHAYSI